MEILSQKIAGSVTVAQAIGIAVGVLVLFVLLKAVLKKAPAEDTLRARMTCGVCGWTGMVSKHKSRCSSCGGTTLTPAAPGTGGRR